MNDESKIETAILRALAARGPDKSICPSEVARDLAPNWRPLLSATRRAAIRLAVAGKIDILRKGRVVDPVTVKGVIRLRAHGVESAEEPDSTEAQADPAKEA